MRVTADNGVGAGLRVTAENNVGVRLRVTTERVGAGLKDKDCGGGAEGDCRKQRGCETEGNY